MEGTRSAYATVPAMVISNATRKALHDRDPARFHDWFVREVTTHGDSRLRYSPDVAAELRSVFDEVWDDRVAVSPLYVHELARVMYASDPDSIAPWPEPGDNKPKGIVRAFLRFHEPWMRLRFDPETMHWWSFSGGMLYDLGDKTTRVALMVSDMLHGLQDYYTAQIAANATDTVLVSKFAKMADAIEKMAGSSVGVANFLKDLVEHPLVWTSGSFFNRIEWVVPFSNGVLFTSPVWNNEDALIADDGEFRASSSPDYLVTSGTRLSWPAHLIGPDGSFPSMERIAPTYDAFLRHAFPEPDEREALMRLLGATVFGRRHKMMVTLIGAPNAGKDTLLGWLDMWLGDQVANLALSTLTEWNQDMERALWPLRNARLAKVPSEVSSTGRKLLADRVKSITNGGSQLLVGAGKYERSASFYFDGPLFLHGNDVPRLTDVDQGIVNRLVAVPFRYPFPGTGDFRQRYQDEAPAFLLFLFEAYRRWVDHGLPLPESWQSFKVQVAQDADEYSVVDNGLVESGDGLPVSVLYNALNHLTVQLGLKPRSHVAIAKVMSTMGLPDSAVTYAGKAVRRVRHVTFNPERTGVDPALWESSLAKAQSEDAVRSLR
jgi:hypothetical protein